MLNLLRCKFFLFSLGALLCQGALGADDASGRPTLGEEALSYISVNAPVVAITQVTVIDGTGSSFRHDQTIVISGGRISAVGPSAATPIPAQATILQRKGYTVIPGLVSMHAHYLYCGPQQGNAGTVTCSPALYSAPRLFLANGVTTTRTAGGIDIYGEMYLRDAIAAGRAIGPRMHVTSPFLDGSASDGGNKIPIRDAAHAERVVAYWAGEGVQGFKLYDTIGVDELGAAIRAAHAHKLKVTGHLCSVTWRQAIEQGIDNLEHGFITATDFFKDKRPGECPNPLDPRLIDAFLAIDPTDEEFQKLLGLLVKNGVAVTSTLAQNEWIFRRMPGIDPVQMQLLTTDERTRVLAVAARRQLDTSNQGTISRADPNSRTTRAIPKEMKIDGAALLRKEMQLERAFVAAGGLLMSGSDAVVPGNLMGFGELRGLELLVEAGFSFSEAVRIFTANGARFLGLLETIGTIEVGKQADLALIAGDLEKDREAIRKISVVFKGGVGYDSKRLIDSVQGQLGLR